MENYNIKLLNETYIRVVNLFKDYSNLNIFLNEILCDDIFRKSSEIYISKERLSPLIFKAGSLKSTEEDNKYSFLLYHKDNDYGHYISSSIFEYAERCRNYYNKYCVNDYSIAYELYSSEAGRIIKELGFPTCLEELIIKMDLMGI